MIDQKLRNRLQIAPEIFPEETLGPKHPMHFAAPLKEFAEACNPDVHIFVSAGSSAIYIGKAGDYLREDCAYVDWFYADQGFRIFAQGASKHAFDPKKHKMPEYTPFDSFLNRLVLNYRGRHLNGEPAMWMVEIEGDEIGNFWTLQESRDWLAKIPNAILGRTKKQ